MLNCNSLYEIYQTLGFSLTMPRCVFEWKLLGGTNLKFVSIISVHR